MSIYLEGNVAYMAGSGSAVYFSKGSSAAGTYKTQRGTCLPVKNMQNALKVAYWGEDNRFPQNIEQQMAHCGVGKSALAWKANALWGAGIIPGKITGYEDGGRTEIFEPLARDKYKPVYSFLESRSLYRFFIEYLQDWVWYFNTFPELVLSKDCKSITGLVHQESCDSRYKQMEDDGTIKTVYLSKLWGAAGDQYAKFDPEKKMRDLMENPRELTEVDNKYVKALDCVDMYNPVESLKAIGEKLKGRGADKLKSAILPVNFPSTNKTYYQVPYWDGSRLAGWVEIAAKVPTIIKAMYNKAFKLKYHIEVPDSYFERRYGYEAWHGMKVEEQIAARKKLLKEMDEFLTGEENAFSSFISFFEVDPHNKTEFGRVKIEALEDKSSLDKELLTSSAADLQVLISMQVDPTLFGAGTIGTGQQRSGGSDKREAWLIYCANLQLERQVMLEPLYLVRDYNRLVGSMNEWEEDIVFRVRDTVLTTLDKGKGTEKVVS